LGWGSGMTPPDNTRFDFAHASTLDELNAMLEEESILQAEQHADWLAEIEASIDTTAAPATPKPTLIYGPFELRSDGVYMDTGAADKGEKPIFAPVCPRLEVLAESVNESGNGWGFVLRWQDRLGKSHQRVIPYAWVSSYDKELDQVLGYGGLKIEPGKTKHIRAYISAVNPTRKMLSVPRTGWQNTQHGRVFVLPNQVIGRGGEDVILDNKTHDPEFQMETSGSLADWQRDIAAYCVNNNLLTFGVSMALAAPTLTLLNEPSRGFHIHGHSSKGKTTILEVAASVWGYRIRKWRTTDNALENTAEYHNDVILTLDELQQINAKDLEAAVYMLGNEEGKERMGEHAKNQSTKKWRMLFLSSGEKTLTEHVAGVLNSDIKAGIEQRMIHLNVEDAGAGMGVFECVHDVVDTNGVASPFHFSQVLLQNKTKYRGVAGPVWATWLIRNEPDAIARMRKMIEGFLARMVPANAGGEIKRAAQIFAVVGAAAELATEAGVTGWPEACAMRSAEWCFLRWLAMRPSLGSSDLEKAVRILRAFLIEHSENRFENLDTPPNQRLRFPMQNRIGFRQKNETTDSFEYFLKPDQLREIIGGNDPQSLVKELARRGHLRTGTGDRLQVQKKIPGISKNGLWFYAVQDSIFHDGEEPPAIMR
jgi:putative DNA primase/helicase